MIETIEDKPSYCINIDPGLKTLIGLPNLPESCDIVKDKISIEEIDKDHLLSRASKLFHNAKQNKTDGIKFIWDNKWVHLRGSNTEPIIRIYAEAPTYEEAKDLVVKVKSLL